MLAAMVLFITPVLLFVVAFLYETYLSFKRLKNPKFGSDGYISATWEVTHTLLVFAVVMLLMLFSSSIDDISKVILLPVFWAGTALSIRAALYIYIFFVRKSPKITWVDWSFAFSHILAALLLVLVVLKSLFFVYKNKPEVNSQFIPYFMPGLMIVLVVCFVPLLYLYRVKDR